MRIHRTIGIAVAFLAFGAAQAAAETVLRFSDYGPNRGTRADALEWFAKELSTRSKGELKIQFYWAGSLLGGRETLGGVAGGVVDMGTVVGFFTPAELALYNIGDLPVDNSDMRSGMRAMYELATGNNALKAEFEKAGVHYVTNYTTGPVQLICRDKVSSLAGIKGLKIRASGPYGDTLRALGAEVVRMSQDDVYQALDSGLINCNQNYFYAMEAYKQYEVAGHVMELDWGQNLSFGIVMNPTVYEGLSTVQKQALDSVASDFIDKLADMMQAEAVAAKSKMMAGIGGKAIVVTGLDDADRARLMEASRASIKAWLDRVSKNGTDGAGVLSAYEALIRKDGGK